MGTPARPEVATRDMDGQECPSYIDKNESFRKSNLENTLVLLSLPKVALSN